jgi:hypothetical protein
VEVVSVGRGESGYGAFLKIAVIVAAVLIAAIPFVYGKYYEFNTDDPFDSSLNVYSAKSLLDGQKLESEVIPSARPATLLVNLIGVKLFGYSEVGPQVIQMIMQLVGLGLMFYALLRVYGPLPASVALILASFYLSCPPYPKFGNVKEQYMIACMLITASSVMLRAVSGRFWWMIIAGASAINIYYFKPTGASVIAAVVVYLMAGPIFRYRTFRQWGIDIVSFVGGMIAGLLPLTLMYAWQGKAGVFLGRFPASIIKTVVQMIIFFGVIWLVIYFVVRERRRIASLLGVFKQVRPIFWKVGAISIAVMLIPWAVYFASKGELESYLYRIYPIGFAMRKWWLAISFVPAILHKVAAAASALSYGYVEASKSVSIFQTQFAKIFGYYRSFTVPIGVSFVAIGIAVCVFFKSAAGFVKSLVSRLKGGLATDSESDSAECDERQVQARDSKLAESFALLFVVWWVLDMVLVWASPRSYVQYFLPFNASASMLAAYVLYHFRKRPWGYVWVLGGWLLVDLLIRTLVPAAGFPYVSFQSPGDYWSLFGKYTIPFAIAVAICVVCRKEKLQRHAVLACGVICVGMFFWLNATNLKTFSKKIEGLKAARSSGQVAAWEQLGKYIRERSNEGDGLYVWGWFPGLYVESKLMCPSSRPAESNMHTTQHGTLAIQTERLVKELKLNPPRYIVDSQKIHFPFYDHPVFDLWPRWEGNKRGRFHLRYHSGQGFNGTSMLTETELGVYSELMMRQVEDMSFALLSNPKRNGGAVEKVKARQMAQDERQRHEAMLPLRNFVSENYKFAGYYGSQVLFELR